VPAQSFISRYDSSCEHKKLCDLNKDKADRDNIVRHLELWHQNLLSRMDTLPAVVSNQIMLTLKSNGAYSSIAGSPRCEIAPTVDFSIENFMTHAAPCSPTPIFSLSSGLRGPLEGKPSKPRPSSGSREEVCIESTELSEGASSYKPPPTMADIQAKPTSDATCFRSKAL